MKWIFAGVIYCDEYLLLHDPWGTLWCIVVAFDPDILIFNSGILPEMEYSWSEKEFQDSHLIKYCCVNLYGCSFRSGSRLEPFVFCLEICRHLQEFLWDAGS